jgi:hypothetical protein
MNLKNLITVILIVALCSCSVTKKSQLNESLQQEQAKSSNLIAQVTAGEKLLVSQRSIIDSLTTTVHILQLTVAEVISQKIDKSENLEQNIHEKTYYENGNLQAEKDISTKKQSDEKTNINTQIISTLQDSISTVNAKLQFTESDRDLYVDLASSLNEDINFYEKQIAELTQKTQTKTNTNALKLAGITLIIGFLFGFFLKNVLKKTKVTSIF